MKSVFGKMLPFFAILVLTSAVQAQTITVQPTFNNAGVEVVFVSDPGSVSVQVSIKRTGSGDAYKLQHPLSKITSTKFAGSVMWLTDNTQYSLEVASTAFPSNMYINFTTRHDSFSTASGTTYHVDPVDGNDGWSGLSEGTAFKSISRAFSAFDGGDELLLYNGTFYEGEFELNSSKSGTAAAPTVMRAAPGQNPKISGMDMSFSPSWTVYSGSIYRTPCTATPRHAYLDSEQLFVFPNLADLESDTFSQGSGAHFSGTHMYVWLGGANPASHDIKYSNKQWFMTLSGVTHFQMKDIDLGYYAGALYHQAIYIYNSHSNLFENCYFHHTTPALTMKQGSSHNVIQNCFFTESPVGTWSWNTVKGLNADEYETGLIYIYVTPRAIQDANVIRNNTFSNVFDAVHLYTIDASYPTKNTDVHDNDFILIADDGIELDGIGSNTRIYENWFFNYNGGVSAAPANIGPHYIVRNRFGATPLLPGGERVPIKFNSGSGLSGNYLYMYHNTCWSDLSKQSGFVLWNYPPAGYTEYIAKNNIFQGDEFLIYSIDDAPIVLDYNLYYSTTGRAFRWQGSDYATPAAFFANYGKEQHGIVTNPLLVNPAANDYSIPEGSSAVDAGVLIPGMNDDYAGTAPDMGYFEFGSGSGATEPPTIGTASADPNPADTDESISFTGSAGGAQPLFYSWTFGDSGTASGSTVQHTYTSEDSYSVRLVVTNAYGADTNDFTVTVADPVIINTNLMQNFDLWGGESGAGTWGSHLYNDWSLANSRMLNWGESHSAPYCAYLHDHDDAPNASFTTPLFPNGADTVQFWLRNYRGGGNNFFNIEKSANGSDWTIITNLIHTGNTWTEYNVNLGVTSASHFRVYKTGDDTDNQYLMLDDFIFMEAQAGDLEFNGGFTGDDDAMFAWECQVGEEFSVYHCEDIVTTNWQLLTNFTATGTTASFNDTGIIAVPMRFYQLRKL